jgi:hypothetical protein
MFKRLLVIFLVFLFAFTILFISVLRSASVKYSYKLEGADKTDSNIVGLNEELEGIFIDYYLPSPGPILPDNPLWKVKALRDKLWLVITTKKENKVLLYLLFADKRLVAAKMLYEKGNYDLGFTTLSKAEIYLKQASDEEVKIRSGGVDTLNLATRIVKASYKHRQVIKQILLIAPNDGKTDIVILENTTRGIYGDKLPFFQGRGIVPPLDPFNGY